jgi:hypothetical protein
MSRTPAKVGRSPWTADDALVVPFWVCRLILETQF